MIALKFIIQLFVSLSDDFTGNSVQATSSAIRERSFFFFLYEQ